MKKLYEYIVKEIVTKRVWVEAENEDEAYHMALREDLSKNFDDYNLNAELVDTEDISPVCRDMVNKWKWTGDAECMNFWKSTLNDNIEVIGLVWFDAEGSDKGYNPEKDCWFVGCWVGDPGDEEVTQGWSEQCYDISGIMSRRDAETWLFDYMEMN